VIRALGRGSSLGVAIHSSLHGCDFSLARGAHEACEGSKNAGALLDALAALGGTWTGRRLDRVSFTPALSGGHCTAFVQLSVPKGGRQRLRLRATSGARTGDTDRLRLVCQ